MSRLQQELSLSELQSKVKYSFGLGNEKTIPKMKTIWEHATEQEKNDIRAVIYNDAALKTRSTDDLVKLAKLNGEIWNFATSTEMNRVKTWLQTKADNAKKAGKLTPAELENVQRVLPNYR